MKKLLLILGLWTISLTGFAQQRSSVKGIVRDENGALPGATVLLKGTTHGTSTDLEGRFQLSNVPPGTQEFVFSYLGYASYSQTIDVKEGINDLQAIQLEATGTQLGEVLVQGTMAPSQMKAMNIKKNADAIMDVMAADAIGKLPDRNAAEAVQRMQGVAVARYHGEADQATVRGTPFSWTSTLLNGTRMPSASVGGSRSAVLDAVPSEIIQYVQVVKAVTPDMESDAIGGSINFITRVAPEEKLFNVSAAAGYNQRSQNATYNGSVVYGDRFLKGKLGFILSASIWNRNWSTDELTTTFNTQLPDPVQKYSINTVLMKRYLGTRRTYGINPGLEYKFNANHRIYVRGLFDKFDDIRPVYESYFDFNNSRYQFNYRYSHYETVIKGMEVGMEHQLASRLKLDWSVSNYMSEFFIDTPPTVGEDMQGLPISTFRQPLTSGYGNLVDGRKYLNFDSPTGVGDDPMKIRPHLNDPNDLIDPDKMTLQQLVILQLDTKEDDKVGQLNLKYDISERVSLKVGGKYRTKDKRAINQRSLVFLPGAGATPITLSSLERTDYPIKGGFLNELNSPYDDFLVDPLTKQQLFDLYKPEYLEEKGWVNKTSASSITSVFDGKENVTAGYIMADFKVNQKLKLVGGVRDEYTSLTMNGSQFKTESTGPTITPTRMESSYHAVLPMMHLKYSLTSKSNIRAAYTRTFVRPGFNDLNPGESLDFTKNPIVVTKGNTSLKPTFASNFDLMGEYYMKNIGLISGGFFYKSIENFIARNVSSETINGESYLITQPKNLENASLSGFEIGITKRLDSLAGIFNGFGVEVNYTMIKSEVEVPRTVAGETVMDKTSLPNQSKNLFNVIVFYERNKLMLRLAGNFRGESLESINQQLGPQFYTWSAHNFTLDMSGAYKISNKMRVFIEVNNLTNTPLKNYLGDSRRIANLEYYSIRGQAGIRFDIF
jgi:TonB-dependent receptor